MWDRGDGSYVEGKKVEIVWACGERDENIFSKIQLVEIPA